MDNDDTDTETVVDRQENHTECNCKPLMISFQDVQDELHNIINENNDSIDYNKNAIVEAKAKLSLLSQLTLECKNKQDELSLESTVTFLEILKKKEDIITKTIEHNETNQKRASITISAIYEALGTLRYKFIDNGDDEDDEEDEDIN